MSWVKARKAEREADRMWRLEHTLADLSRVMRMKREGLSVAAIAQRIGWTERTLFRWLEAVKVFERKGIKMADE